ncbi:MAG: MFS transporter [Chloroflexi bacterium]|nr:MFS transporter [Chloroflexota bacterium]
MRPALGLTVLLLAVELLDELVFGAQGAALPLIRDDLHLSYEQIGLLLGVPIVLANLIEPALGLLADTGKRRVLIVGGGIGFALALALVGGAQSFIALLIGFVLLNPSSGAFVSLSQAALMDLHPARREPMMARWTVAGSLGVLGGSLALSAVAALRGDWRLLYFAFAMATLGMVAVLWPQRALRGGTGGEPSGSLRDGLRALRTAVRDRRVLRWLACLELADLMGDTLLGFTALYFVDVAGVDEAQGALAVTVLTGEWLAGNVALIPLLERVRGLTYLRASVPLTLVLYAAWLAAPEIWLKYVLLGAVGLAASGWYAVIKANLYGVLPERSGLAMALAALSGVLAGLVPGVLGWVAEQYGLPWAMALLALGPLGLLMLLPRGESAAGGTNDGIISRGG